MAALAILCACAGKEGKGQGADGENADSLAVVTVKYATGFSVRDSADVRLVDVGRHDHFALVNNDTITVPEGYTKVLVPIQRTICMTALATVELHRPRCPRRGERTDGHEEPL